MDLATMEVLALHFVLSFLLAIVSGNTKIKVEEDCELSYEQWELLTWYFERVSYMEVTQINRHEIIHKRTSKFASYMVRQLFYFTGIEYQTFRVDYSYQDTNIPHSHTYEWHAKRFESRDQNHSQHELTPWIEDTKLTIKNRIKASNQVREDEPDFGAIVMAENIQIFDNYLNGIDRHPFHAKRAHYALVVYKEVDSKTWDKWAASVMAKLWKDHGILNAIVLAACKRENVGYFDPYVNVASLHLPQVDEWGIFRCVPINLLNFKNDDWLLRKDSSLNGFPLTITMFSRYPTVIPEHGIPPTFLETQYAQTIKYSQGLGGFDGFVLGNIAKELEFKVQIITPQSEGPVRETYGRKKANGTFIGTIGDVLYGRADASFNARFLIDYGTDEIEFMFPVLMEKVCVIAPAAEKIPQWTAIFKCFDVWVWSAFALVTCICGGFWFMLKIWRKIKYNLREVNNSSAKFTIDERTFHSVFVAIWMIMLGATTTMPIRKMERLFISACLLANVIIVGTFQGSLYTSFSTVSYYKDLDTLADLDKSGLPIAASSHSLRYLFGSDTNSSLLDSLNRKYKIYEVNAIQRAANHRDMCSVERFSDVHIIIRTNYLRPDGSPKLHVIKECPRDFFLSYIVRKGWPLLPRFNMFLKRFSEYGFLNLWYKQTEDAFIMYSLIKNPFPSTNRNKRQAFTLTDMQTPFYILVIGYMLCSITFLVEVFILPPSQRISKDAEH